MQLQDPSSFHHIEFSGFLITEPVTAGTDLIIFVVATYIAYKLFSSSKKNLESNLWTLFFLFIGLSTLAGAFSHGLRFYLVNEQHVLMFSLMNIFSGFSSLSAQFATYKYQLNNRPGWLKFLFYFLFVAFNISVLYTQLFAITNIYVTLTFLLVLFIHYRSWKNQKKGEQQIFYGILFSFITAFVFLFKLSLSDKWFNHKDLAHVLIMISLIIMYRGAKEIQ